MVKKLLAFSITCLVILMSFSTISGNDSLSVAMLNEDLIVTVTTDKEIYDIGEPIAVTICVANTGDEDITIVFPNTQLPFSRV